MGARFEPNHAGIAAFGRSPGMQQAMQQLAGLVQERAVAISPVKTGRYKASWRTTSGVKDGRAFGRVYNTARNPRNGYHYPAALERGNSRIRKQRILGRALDAARQAR
jgi:hypothetical protein